MIGRMRLSTVTSSRQTLARVIRAFNAGDLSESDARTLRYLLDGLLGFFKHEADLRIEERIEEIEKRLAK